MEITFNAQSVTQTEDWDASGKEKGIERENERQGWKRKIENRDREEYREVWEGIKKEKKGRGRKG